MFTAPPADTLEVDIETLPSTVITSIELSDLIIIFPSLDIKSFLSEPFSANTCVFILELLTITLIAPEPATPLPPAPPKIIFKESCVKSDDNLISLEAVIDEFLI